MAKDSFVSALFLSRPVKGRAFEMPGRVWKAQAWGNRLFDITPSKINKTKLLGSIICTIYIYLLFTTLLFESVIYASYLLAHTYLRRCHLPTQHLTPLFTDQHSNAFTAFAGLSPRCRAPGSSLRPWGPRLWRAPSWAAKALWGDPLLVGWGGQRGWWTCFQGRSKNTKNYSSCSTCPKKLYYKFRGIEPSSNHDLGVISNSKLGW